MQGKIKMGAPRQILFPEQFTRFTFSLCGFCFHHFIILLFFQNQLISVVSKAKLQGDRCIAKREVSLFSDKLGLFAESILSYII